MRGEEKAFFAKRNDPAVSGGMFISCGVCKRPSRRCRGHLSPCAYFGSAHRGMVSMNLQVIATEGDNFFEFGDRLEMVSMNKVKAMCRSIKVLRKPEQLATAEEVSAAALQFVRKISGFHKPSKANEEAFYRAVREITDSSRRLLEAIAASPVKVTTSGTELKTTLTCSDPQRQPPSTLNVD
jgi:hypothetical protein